MNAQRNLFIITFLVVSFLLWEIWKNEHPSTIIIQNTNINNSEKFKSQKIDQYTSSSIQNKANLITIQTDVLLIKINTAGGNIEEAYLINYLDNLKSKKPFNLLNTSQEFIYQANSELVHANPPNNPTSITQLSYNIENNNKKYTIPKNQNTLEIILNYHNTNDGVIYIKKYIFNRASYAIDVHHKIHNTNHYPIKMKLMGNLTQSISLPKSYHNKDSFPLYSYRGAAYSTDTEKYQKYSFKNIKHTNLNINTSTGWIAMLQKYFVTAWIPLTPTNYTFYTTHNNKKYASIGFQSDTIHIPEETYKEFQSILWIGPKIQKEIKKIAPNLNLVIDYGWLWFISQPLFTLLSYINSYINNWGISIIIITLIIRLTMYPLSKAQYTSIAKIRMLQPKLNLIQEKYKNNKYQYHQKTIELYKSEKVNPLGGCLPLLIQMPIFLALYYMLSESIELRHAKFGLWINDLSSKDPYYILPILMGISMFYIQKLSPTTISDPLQKKIMNLMLIIFTIFFLWFPSGLVLYYTISNTITIIQQQIIYQELKKKGLHT